MEQRRAADQSSEAVKRRLNQALRASIDNARVVVTTPPTVRGFSSETGLSMQLLDRSGGSLTLQEFEAVSKRFISTAMASGGFERVSTRFDASSPRWRLELDRNQMAALNLNYAETLRDIGTAIGGRYIDDTYEGGRIRTIYLQLEGRGRATPEDLLAMTVRSRDGHLIPLSNVARLIREEGANAIPHFDLKRSIALKPTATTRR